MEAAAQGGPVRRNNGARVSRICFTINNWKQEEWDWLTTIFANQVKWIVIGKETGEKGTSHLQGACILGTQWSFSKLKTLIGFKRAHVESMRGRPEDSLVYCSKEDLHPFVKGTLPTPGKRTDVEAAVRRVQAGESLRAMSKDEEGGVAITKWYKGLTVLRSLNRPNRNGAPFVFWFFGATGTGKTRTAFKVARYLAKLDKCPKDDIWISSGGLKWFDGYDGQCAAILDDFRAKHVSSFPFFLRLLDRYPIQCEFKGGHVSWTPKYIFITCPYDPERCFDKRQQHVPEDIAQLKRRITSVMEFRNELTKEGRALVRERVYEFIQLRDDISMAEK